MAALSQYTRELLHQRCDVSCSTGVPIHRKNVWGAFRNSEVPGTEFLWDVIEDQFRETRSTRLLSDIGLCDFFEIAIREYDVCIAVIWNWRSVYSVTLSPFNQTPGCYNHISHGQCICTISSKAEVFWRWYFVGLICKIVLLDFVEPQNNKVECCWSWSLLWSSAMKGGKRTESLSVGPPVWGNLRLEIQDHHKIRSTW
jgi:hypothetical protein